MPTLTPLWKDFTYQEHQVVGIQWMCEKESDDFPGGIVCDEMGLGKTIEVLGLMKNAPMKNTLLVAPLATLNQWIEKGVQSGFRVKKPSRFIPWESVNPKAPEDICLYVVNYEKIIHRPALIESVVWDRVVFDEAHRLRTKNRGWFAAEAIPSYAKWFLTATPIVNDVDDVRHLFQIMGYPVVPTGLLSLQPLIEEKVLARKMDDIRDTVKGLPNAAIIKKHHIEFDSEKEAEFYNGIQGGIVKKWKALLEDGNLTAQHRFQLLMRLRQISLHPQVYIAARKKFYRGYSRQDWLGPSTKFSYLQRLIKAECDTSHRWLIFCHFHTEMELLQAHLSMLPHVRRVQIYSGELTESMRTQVVEASKEPLKNDQHEILLCQLQSGGVGLNLQHFDRVCFMGPWWTAALMDQAVGRAVRIGQTEQVYVHHIILKAEESAEETVNIDHVMLDKVEMKRLLCDKFLELASSGLDEDDDAKSFSTVE